MLLSRIRGEDKDLNILKTIAAAGFIITFIFNSANASNIHVPADYATIQEAVDSAVGGDKILLADMVFQGPGNFDIDFRGKAITVKSESGNAPACVIDIQGEYNNISQRGFLLWNGEDSTSVIRDLTIINGVADGP